MLLKKGSSGENVKLLQEFLKISADGDFGPGTEKTVKEWQTKNGLTADGIVGPATLKKMGITLKEETNDFDTTWKGKTIEGSHFPDRGYGGPTKRV